MSNPGRLRFFLLGLAIFSCLQAHAQTPYLNVQGSNFDVWCQEHAKLPPDRCDRRTPEDEKAYQTYRDHIGDYEETLRLQRQKKNEVDRTFLHNDPIDNPHSQ